MGPFDPNEQEMLRRMWGLAPDTSPDVTALKVKSSSLRKEWHTRANALDADVAELAAQIPAHMFKMRVKTTRYAQLSPMIVATGLSAAYVAAAIPLAFFVSVSALVVAGVLGMLVAYFVAAIMGLTSTPIPFPTPGYITVYVKDGHLATVAPGYEHIPTSWKLKTCTRLLDDEDILLGSLLAELERGIDTYFGRLDVLDAGREAALSVKERAKERADVQSEVDHT